VLFCDLADSTSLARWRQACTGAGQVVFLGGEAGIGKSRLMSALRAALPPESHTLLAYQCSPFHGSTPLHPIIVQLRHASGIRRNESPGQMVMRLRETLRGPGEALDGPVALLGELMGIALDEELAGELPTPALRKDRTLQILMDQLAALQDERPVLMLFEDVH
jgi:predicted ATPase